MRKSPRVMGLAGGCVLAVVMSLTVATAQTPGHSANRPGSAADAQAMLSGVTRLEAP